LEVQEEGVVRCFGVWIRAPHPCLVCDCNRFHSTISSNTSSPPFMGFSKQQLLARLKVRFVLFLFNHFSYLSPITKCLKHNPPLNVSAHRSFRFHFPSTNIQLFWPLTLR